jgi:hypothetical protein
MAAVTKTTIAPKRMHPRAFADLQDVQQVMGTVKMSAPTMVPGADSDTEDRRAADHGGGDRGEEQCPRLQECSRLGEETGNLVGVGRLNDESSIGGCERTGALHRRHDD